MRPFDMLAKNWHTAVPTIIVMALALSMFHGLLLVYGKASDSLQNLSSRFSITVYLKDSTDAFARAALINQLEERSDVITPVVYTSKEQAWEVMTKTFSLDNELLAKYQFSLPASLTITPRSPQDTEDIEEFLTEKAGALIQEATSTQAQQKKITGQMVEFIKNVRSSTLQTLVLLLIFFIVGGALLISSTLHMAISSRHREISIMELVGASYSKMTLPFIIESFILTLAAYFLHILLLLIIPGTEIFSAASGNALLAELVVIMALSFAVSTLTTRILLK